MRAPTSSAPRCRCTGVQCASGRASPASRCSRASRRPVGACAGSATIQSPRRMSARSRPLPARLSASRWPARPQAASRLCTCSPRTRTSTPRGDTSSRSPGATVPDSAVPVTTVPTPASVKQRSTARRKFPCPAAAGCSAASCASRRSSASMPSPVADETASSSASASEVPASIDRTSSPAAASRPASTRSLLVSATMPRDRPSRSMIARCSRVCGIGPSSAATTSSTQSMPVAPASMLRTSFSCPGMSTKPSRPPSSSGLKA